MKMERERRDDRVRGGSARLRVQTLETEGLTDSMTPSGELLASGLMPGRAEVVTEQCRCACSVLSRIWSSLGAAMARRPCLARYSW